MSNGELTNSDDPQAEYERRHGRATGEVARLDRQDSTLSTVRGVTFLAAVGVGGLGLREVFSLGWLLVPLTAFGAAVVVHGRVLAALKLARCEVAYYQRSLDRLRDRWAGAGADGARYGDPEHVYVDDLDIFGPGSLFQLVCRARTRLGEDRLAAWLRQAADRDAILARQRAVSELRQHLDLREQLALLDAEARVGFDQNKLLEWSAQTARVIRLPVRLAGVFLSATTVVTFLAWWFLGKHSAPLTLSLLALMLYLFAHRRLISDVLKGVDDAGKGLMILSQVLGLMEGCRFESPLLAEIVGRLDVEGRPPSRTIARLHARIQSLNNSVRNQFFAPMAVVLCLPVHLVHAIEYWRGTVGRHIPDWCEAVSDFEALISLGGFSYEHPGCTFPKISTERALLKATQLGHPLLPQTSCVRNDVQLDGEVRLLLVSGSNMSGKSTLLRTVGTNVVLALAGAPVRAEQLEISVFQLGTAMRISDSLQEGKSLFFAVLGRLKRVVDLTECEQPLLFLLDEILQGTNSHDRRIGAEAVIRSLLDRGAVGLVTTHDLALTDIAASLPHTENVHFADQLQDGNMTFDYRLRPGVVQKSNAIELMRLVGLDV